MKFHSRVEERQQIGTVSGSRAPALGLNSESLPKGWRQTEEEDVLLLAGSRLFRLLLLRLPLPDFQAQMDGITELSLVWPFRPGSFTSLFSGRKITMGKVARIPNES